VVAWTLEPLSRDSDAQSVQVYGFPQALPRMGLNLRNPITLHRLRPSNTTLVANLNIEKPNLNIPQELCRQGLCTF
jgi:hypothetical protein